MDLIQWCIVQVEKEIQAPIQVIIDPCAGAGTTAVAAKNLEKRCVTIDLERSYCDATVRRLQQNCFKFTPTIKPQKETELNL